MPRFIVGLKSVGNWSLLPKKEVAWARGTPSKATVTFPQLNKKGECSHEESNLKPSDP